MADDHLSSRQPQPQQPQSLQPQSSLPLQQQQQQPPPMMTISTQQQSSLPQQQQQPPPLSLPPSMATTTQWFGIGAVIKLVTLHEETIQGEVLAFDHNVKATILKCPASNGKSENSDIRFVNLNNLRHLEMIKGAPKSSLMPSVQPAPLPNLNYTKLSLRKKSNADEKMKKINYIGSGVSAIAQKLFDTILKTIPEIEWNGEKILVMKSVIISPPYLAENCQMQESQSVSQTKNNGQSLNHVRKIVTKFHDDSKEMASTPSSISSPSPPALA